MTRQLVLASVIVLALLYTNAAYAQEECSPDILSNTINELMSNYSVQIESADTTNTALDALEAMSADIDNIYNRCANIVSPDELPREGNGTGNLDDPFAFNFLGDSGAGHSIQITRLIRPADDIIRNANMFNTRPSQGEAYIILEVNVFCQQDSSRCETSSFNFELAGSKGVVYDSPFVSIDGVLDVNLFPGATSSGRLVFLIDSSDTNLVLLYRPNIFMDEFVAYSAEPDLSNGIQITSQSSINIRIEPSTNADVAGNLSANTPVVAFGRNSNSTWLQIESGWVFGELVTFDGDISILPVTAD